MKRKDSIGLILAIVALAAIGAAFYFAEKESEKPVSTNYDTYAEVIETGNIGRGSGGRYSIFLPSGKAVQINGAINTGYEPGMKFAAAIDTTSTGNYVIYYNRPYFLPSEHLETVTGVVAVNANALNGLKYEYSVNDKNYVMFQVYADGKADAMRKMQHGDTIKIEYSTAHPEHSRAVFE